MKQNTWGYIRKKISEADSPLKVDTFVSFPLLQLCCSVKFVIVVIVIVLHYAGGVSLFHLMVTWCL
jgi:hypothetical protein